MTDYEYLFKIIAVGDSGVGKTATITQYVDNIFSENHISTIGVDFKIKTIEYLSKIIKLQIWDTAGQERFRTVTSSYYRGADGIIIIFDKTNIQSFYNIEKWISEIKNYSKENVKILIVGNKSDLENIQVSDEEIEKLCQKLNLNYISTSAKTGENTDIIFEKIIELIFYNINTNSFTPSTIRNKIQISNNTTEIKQNNNYLDYCNLL
jgi:Ras-related protein Rab-1A